MGTRTNRVIGGNELGGLLEEGDACSQSIRKLSGQRFAIRRTAVRIGRGRADRILDLDADA